MSQARRQELIAEIEKLRGSRVVAYITGDRQPATAAIGDDAVRPIIEHLRAIGKAERLDVFLYSRGGAIDVPWRLNTALRNASDTWSVLVPFRANSAATLLALGSDEIVLGRQGELGPIDPIMTFQKQGPGGPTQDQVSVEDVMAFPKFVKDRAGLTDQQALGAALSKLADRLDPVALGNAYRTHSHIRYVARHMLLSRRSTAEVNETSIDAVVETLAERVYAHGHAIGLAEAQEMGLHAKEAPTDLEQAMWDLLTTYEEDMHLLEPIDPAEKTLSQDRFQEAAVLAMVESVGLTHSFSGELVIDAQRQMPPSLQLNLNMPIQLPPGVDPAQLGPALEQALAQAQQALLAAAQQAALDALRAQAPLQGFNVRLLGGAWIAS